MRCIQVRVAEWIYIHVCIYIYICMYIYWILTEQCALHSLLHAGARLQGPLVIQQQTPQEARRQTQREWFSAALRRCSRGLSVIVNPGLQRPARSGQHRRVFFMRWDKKGQNKRAVKEGVRLNCWCKFVVSTFMSQWDFGSLWRNHRHIFFLSGLETTTVPMTRHWKRKLCIQSS